MISRLLHAEQLTPFNEDGVFTHAGESKPVNTPRYRPVRRGLIGASVLVAFSKSAFANPIPSPDTTANRRVVAEAIAGIVQQRLLNGLGGLEEHPLLTECANAYALALSTTSCMGHECGSTLTERLRKSGYSYSRCAENLAWGYGCADLVVTGWMGSSGHRKNILTPELREIGLAVVASQSSSPSPVWVSVFGTRLDDRREHESNPRGSPTPNPQAGLCFDAVDESTPEGPASDASTLTAWVWRFVSRKTRSFLYPASP